MNNQVSLDIKKIINEGFIDNTIDSAANTLKEHKGKIALVGGALAYHFSPIAHQIIKNLGHAVSDPLMRHPNIAKGVADLSTATTAVTGVNTV